MVQTFTLGVEPGPLVESHGHQAFLDGEWQSLAVAHQGVPAPDLEDAVDELSLIGVLIVGDIHIAGDGDLVDDVASPLGFQPLGEALLELLGFHLAQEEQVPDDSIFLCVLGVHRL